MDFSLLDERPAIIAIAGSNGAGKSTFYQSHLADTGLPFINADDISACLNIDAYDAANMADVIRRSCVANRESFVFETVFSDPVGAKVQFLKDAVAAGYHVVLIFIQITNVETSIQRVSMRVAQGGHDVPDEKLRSRFERTRKNLQIAIEQLPKVFVFDNTDLSYPYRLVEVWQDGQRVLPR